MKPEDFPLGSLESRAAARTLLAHKNDSRKRMRIMWSIPSPGEDNSRLHFGEWHEWEDNTLGQIVYIPHTWLKAGETVPVCPDCGTPYKKSDEFPNLIGYEASCMNKHDPELK
jgi:hypothetical protein